MKWVITTPAWGERCIKHFRDYAYPAMRKALALLPSDDPVRFIVHTDRPQELSFIQHECQLLPLPDAGSPNSHAILGACHRQILEMVEMGEVIVFINADMVCSIEAFAAARRRLESGKKLVLVMGTRTLEEGDKPPIGAKSRDLLQWAWDHQHGWITGCTWGTGRSKIPAVVYFKLKDGVVLHAFHLHPFVLLKDREVSFKQTTIDADLIEKFRIEQIHVVTEADEMAFAEMSPKVIPTFPASAESGQPLTKEVIADFARHTTSHTHRWVFGHRIIISGTCVDMADAPVCSDILACVELHIPLPPLSGISHLAKERQELLLKEHAEKTKDYAGEKCAFHVVIPAWGPRCVGLVCDYIIPCLREALKQGDFSVQVTVYTDQPERMRAALLGLVYNVRLMAERPGNPHDMLNTIHKQILIETPTGSIAVMLTGDIIFSKELFLYASGVMKAGRRVIGVPCPRTVIKDEPPPVGVTARQLYDWAWRNHHSISEACVWGRAHTTFPNTLFFEDGDNVVMHTFHIHPFVILKDRNCKWSGTIDDDLLVNYQDSEIQYVQNAEVGFAEISPADYCSGPHSQYNVGELLTVDAVANWSKHIAPVHWRNFRRQLRLVGFGDVPQAKEISEAIALKVRPSMHVPFPFQPGSI